MPGTLAPLIGELARCGRSRRGVGTNPPALVDRCHVERHPDSPPDPVAVRLADSPDHRDAGLSRRERSQVGAVVREDDQPRECGQLGGGEHPTQAVPIQRRRAEHEDPPRHPGSRGGHLPVGARHDHQAGRAPECATRHRADRTTTAVHVERGRVPASADGADRCHAASISPARSGPQGRSARLRRNVVSAASCRHSSSMDTATTPRRMASIAVRAVVASSVPGAAATS